MKQEVSFEEKARNFWNKEHTDKVTGGKKYPLLPRESAHLLRTLGLLNKDATMSADQVRKYSQINHMVLLLEPFFQELVQRHKNVRVLDAGCGNSFLTFLLAWCFQKRWGHPAELVGADSSEKIILGCIEKAESLGLSDTIKFVSTNLATLDWKECYQRSFLSQVTHNAEDTPRPHAVVALHACDVATDFALAIAVREKADFIAVAPCCQAELARKWKDLGTRSGTKQPFDVVFKSPHLRRETAAHITDAMRVLLMRGCGYEVTATEFVPSNHTPKNRLMTCVRRGRILETALQEYLELKNAMGGEGISLELLLPEEYRKVFSADSVS